MQCQENLVFATSALYLSPLRSSYVTFICLRKLEQLFLRINLFFLALCVVKTFLLNFIFEKNRLFSKWKVGDVEENNS